MSDKGRKRRQDQSQRDKQAELERRRLHLHDEARLKPRVVASTKPSPSDDVTGIGHNRGPPLDRLDLLYGAEEIGRYIGRSKRWVYHQQKNLGLGHIGGTLVGSCSKLAKLLAGEAV
jgi:hypothetical protein